MSQAQPVLSTLTTTQYRRALEVLSPIVAGYYAGGSGAEVTLAESEDAWRTHRFRPHVLRDVAEVDTTLHLLGSTLTAPVLAGPAAYQVLAHPEGEVATARGVGAAGGVQVVSSRCSTRLEDVAAAVTGAGGDWWFQCYVFRDRAITVDLVQRAAAAGARAVVLTGDTPVVGTKLRQGTEFLPLTDAITGVNIDVPIVEDLLPGGLDLSESLREDPSVTLAEIDWLAGLSGLPVLVKGVLRGDDARESVAAGAAGIIVSTHGGRQLDRAVASARALPEVVAAVPPDVPVLVDGGIRTAADVLVALALGARAVLVARPVLWALAADGAAGVAALLEGFRHDLVEVLQLAGCRDLSEVTRDLLT